jgi:hypothetical protein
MARIPGAVAGDTRATSRSGRTMEFRWFISIQFKPSLLW